MCAHNDPSILFRLRVKLSGGTLAVTARDMPAPGDNRTGHSYIAIEAKWNGKVLFPEGVTYCGVNAWTSTDGVDAKRLVLSTLAMKLGDTDRDYFESYTQDQLDWSSQYGEELSLMAYDRYGEV